MLSSSDHRPRERLIYPCRRHHPASSLGRFISLSSFGDFCGLIRTRTWSSHSLPSQQTCIVFVPCHQLQFALTFYHFPMPACIHQLAPYPRSSLKLIPSSHLPYLNITSHYVSPLPFNYHTFLTNHRPTSHYLFLTSHSPHALTLSTGSHPSLYLPSFLHPLPRTLTDHAPNLNPLHCSCPTPFLSPLSQYE